jgi:predicted XRE-type DNA-binding protein
MSTEPREPDGAVTSGTENVFTDLGLPSNEEAMIKAAIALAITQTVKRRGLSQTEAAQIVGTDQPKMSAILRGRLSQFKLDRLLRYLLLLGRDIEIRVADRVRSEPGKLRMRG